MSSINYKFAVLIMLFSPLPGISCELKFDGSEFLRSSYAKGISPITNCLEANFNDNKFYSLPNKSCEVTFSKSSWLNQEWNFKSIQGSGTFSVQMDGDDLKVIIRKQGGFHLNSVTLQSQTVSCNNITVDAVL